MYYGRAGQRYTHLQWEEHMAMPTGGDYDAYAEAYAPNVARRERDGAENDPYGILPPMLELLGDLTDRRVLDAGCGEGYLARVLAASGARVTGMDISPRLIEQARRKDSGGAIDYRVADLSCPLPEEAGSFDAVASYLVLNDVPDYKGFARTIASVLCPGGKAVLAFNNPYYGFLSRHVTDYFDSDRVSPYRGLWSAGIKVYYHHRTLEEYLDSFLSSGLRLTKLADLASLADHHPAHAIVPEGNRFPRFMLLGFMKPLQSSVDTPGREPAPSNLIGANRFAVGGRSLGRRGLCAVHATNGSTLDGVFSRRKNRRHRWTGYPH
jgi:2-polyprenyl-3-methyl-5-hydroxy-6-metoxy-1,4-benzoquinol methylase